MRIAALGLLASLCATPALSAEYSTEKQVCAAAYGALADQAKAMAEWAPALARSNLTSIDWTARKAKVIGGSAIYEAAAVPRENDFKMKVIADRIDGTASGSARLLEQSQACDKAFGLSPSFAMP